MWRTNYVSTLINSVSFFIVHGCILCWSAFQMESPAHLSQDSELVLDLSLAEDDVWQLLDEVLRLFWIRALFMVLLNLIQRRCFWLSAASILPSGFVGLGTSWGVPKRLWGKVKDTRRGWFFELVDERSAAMWIDWWWPLAPEIILTFLRMRIIDKWIFLNKETSF